MAAARSTGVVAILCLSLGALALSPSAQGAAFPGANGRIAYASNESGNWEIYSMDADGSGKERLTGGPGDSTQPSFSADGNRIAFASNRTGNWDIFTMNAGGDEVTQLTTDPGADTQPTFSPDGSQIAFIGKRGTSWYGHVYVMNADGSDQTRLIAEFGNEERPTFSPDGQAIAVGQIESKHRQIVTMNTAGGDLAVLTHGQFDSRWPTFSPDGQSIAFSSRRDGPPEIFTMHTDGSGTTRLTDAPSQMPACSPDGKKIAFVSGGDIYSMDATGGGEVRLAKGRHTQAWPTWQPITSATRGEFAGHETAAKDRLRVGRPILDRRRGTAKLPVSVPAAGTLTLQRPGIRRVAGRRVPGPMTVKLSVRPKRKLAAKLTLHGRARLKVRVSLALRDGGVESLAKTLTLRRKR